MTATSQRLINYLLVEDNDDHADLIERCFQHGNIPSEIRRVRMGAECLAYLAGDEPFANRTEHPYPDVVLLDIRMPGVLDGLQTLQGIRSDPRHRHLSIMMLTSSNRESDVSRAYELGASGYVVKSSDTSEMIETLRQLQLSFRSFNRVPERNSTAEPNAATESDKESANSVNLESILESDPNNALRLLVAAYRKDRDEAMQMLKILENANTTRFADIVARFCMEQRHLFAGGREVDWTFIRRVVMEKLPLYEDPERVAGIVANISAVLESNEWASGENPTCQAWRGFSTAYLNQRWLSTANNSQQTKKEPPRAYSLQRAIKIAAIAALLAGAVGFIVVLII